MYLCLSPKYSLVKYGCLGSSLQIAIKRLIFQTFIYLAWQLCIHVLHEVGHFFRLLSQKPLPDLFVVYVGSRSEPGDEDLQCRVMSYHLIQFFCSHVVTVDHSVKIQTRKNSSEVNDL